MSTLGTLARSLSARAELLLVAVIAFGWLGVRSLAILVTERTRVHTVSDRMLLATTAVEFVAGGCALLLLHARGLRLSRAVWGISWRSTGLGVGVCLATFAAYFVVWNTLVLVLGNSFYSHVTLAGSASLGAVLLASAVNPVFEEVFEVWYLTERLAQRGFWFVAIVSVTLTMAIHASQWPHSLGSVVPGKVIFLAVYWRGRKLWPLVFAHVLGDLGMLRFT